MCVENNNVENVCHSEVGDIVESYRAVRGKVCVLVPVPVLYSQPSK